jgi:SAM-dependent methyltransferase
MRIFDRVLQEWRARVARPWIPRGARVLDIGCHQGELLRSLGDHISPSVGLDPQACPENCPEHDLFPYPFVEPLSFPAGCFDVVVLLATFEHIPDREPLGRECFRLLRPGGRVIITVPSPKVDKILAPLCRFRLADGMSLHEHDGFDPQTTPLFFTGQGFVLEHWHRFQLGLNNLFIFCKPVAVPVRSTEARPACILTGNLAHA